VRDRRHLFAHPAQHFPVNSQIKEPLVNDLFFLFANQWLVQLKYLFGPLTCNLGIAIVEFDGHLPATV
jgi:hypothetical protein